MSHPAVLVMIYGAARGASLGGRPAFRLVAEPGKRLRVTDLAATRGDGVFETIGVFDGRPANLGPHLERLARSAAMIDLPDLDLGVFEQAVETAVTAHLPVPELLVKVVVSRGIEGTGVPTAWVHAQTAPSYAAERAGLKVVALDRGISTTAPETSPWLLAGAKTLSYATNMAALREAQRRGAQEVLFVSSDGFALEGPTSTLLVRRGETFSTTPASAGVLPGTSLASVAEHLRASGREVTEELLTPDDVAASDGAWLLSSGRLACPITHLDDQPLPVDQALSEELSRVISGRAER